LARAQEYTTEVLRTRRMAFYRAVRDATATSEWFVRSTRSSQRPPTLGGVQCHLEHRPCRTTTGSRRSKPLAHTPEGLPGGLVDPPGRVKPATVVDARCPAPARAWRSAPTISPRTSPASRKRTSALAGCTFTSTCPPGRSTYSATTGCPMKPSKVGTIPDPNGSVGYSANARNTIRRIGTTIGRNDLNAEGAEESRARNSSSLMSGSGSM
jgi:hypothetical protein